MSGQKIEMPKTQELELMRSKGGVVLSPTQLPFTEAECQTLSDRLSYNEESYHLQGGGDTEEAGLGYVNRVKAENGGAYKYDAIEEIFTSEKMITFLKQQTGLKNPVVDRMNSNIYKEGCFVGRHVDSESWGSYALTCILCLDDQYTGGKFMVYRNDGAELAFHPPKFHMILTPSELPHEVKKVESGNRHHLCFFIRDTSQDK